MPAGFLGVEIFFVVSGYLITSLLLAERSARGSVSLKHFWARRARRLLPAPFLLVAAVLTYFTIFLPDEVASIRGDALASVGYIANWAFIVPDTSYFEQVGRPSPLLHLWSLAIEEQFYLLWPLIFIGLTWLGGRRLLLPAIVLGAIASTWLMAALYQPFGDVSRIYYGTDTRSAGLLIGAALAVVWGAGALPSPRAGVAAWLWRASGLGSALRWSLDVAGLASLGGLVYIVVTWSEFQQSLYQGGFALVSVLTVVVIAATVAPGGVLGRALGVAPLRWIGLRSYAIYLWHWPIFVITRPDLDVSMGDTELLLFRLALTLLLAELSYRLVETPVRRGALGRIWSRLRDQERPRLRRELQRGALVFPALGGAIALAFVVAAAQPAAPPSFIPTERVSTIAPAAASAPLRTQAAPLDDSTLTDGAHAVLQRIPPAPGALTTSPASSTIERLGAASVSTIAPPTGLPAASAPPPPVPQQRRWHPRRHRPAPSAPASASAWASPPRTPALISKTRSPRSSAPPRSTSTPPRPMGPIPPCAWMAKKKSAASSHQPPSCVRHHHHRRRPSPPSAIPSCSAPRPSCKPPSAPSAPTPKSPATSIPRSPCSAATTTPASSPTPSSCTSATTAPSIPNSSRPSWNSSTIAPSSSSTSASRASGKTVITASSATPSRSTATPSSSIGTPPATTAPKSSGTTATTSAPMAPSATPTSSRRPSSASHPTHPLPSRRALRDDLTRTRAYG